MIVAWSWLKEYVDLRLGVDELVDRLMMSGLNHESTEDVAGDIAIDLEVTSNRPDCLGHLGIAREIAVLTGQTVKIPDVTLKEDGPAIETLTSVDRSAPADSWCPQYRARVIQGIKVGPSPKWLARRLEAIGLTPINNVVDVTNYVLHESGQPLHAFDFDKLSGRKIVVRAALAGEKFQAINGKTYELKPGMGVIADDTNAVALAGVMGGKETEVSDSTVNILLEAAEFSPISIRKTSRALDLSSDSSYRFERKIDPTGVEWACERACKLIVELAGGAVARGFIHHGQQPWVGPRITLRHARLLRVLGFDVTLGECRDILGRLGLRIESIEADQLVVTAPSFRRDLVREIDLIEEIGRVHGYADVDQERLIPMAIAPPSKDQIVRARVRESLMAAGFQEAVTFSFTDEKAVKRIRPWSREEPIKLHHSSRKHENRLRQSLLPSLLDAMRLNEARGNESVRLAEIAKIYLPSKAGLPEEPTAIGLVAEIDIRVMRGVVDSILTRLSIPAEFVPQDVAGFQEGASALYKMGDRVIAVIGVFADKTRQAIDLRAPAVGVELLLEPLVESARLDVRVAPVVDRPAITRDLAIVLDESTPWSELAAVVTSSAGPLMEDFTFVDLYRGKQVPPGKKSIAFRMVFRSAERTLTHEEVDGYQSKILESIAKNLGGTLRA